MKRVRSETTVVLSSVSISVTRVGVLVVVGSSVVAGSVVVDTVRSTGPCTTKAYVEQNERQRERKEGKRDKHGN